MGTLKVTKVTEYPSVSVADTLYLKGTTVDSKDTLGIQVSSSDATNTYSLVGTAEVASAILEAAESGHVERVADIAARDALSLTSNRFVVVDDASADGVTGEGLYQFDFSDDTYTLLNSTAEAGLPMATEDW